MLEQNGTVLNLQTNQNFVFLQCACASTAYAYLMFVYSCLLCFFPAFLAGVCQLSPSPTPATQSPKKPPTKDPLADLNIKDFL